MKPGAMGWIFAGGALLLGYFVFKKPTKAIPKGTTSVPAGQQSNVLPQSSTTSTPAAETPPSYLLRDSPDPSSVLPDPSATAYTPVGTNGQVQRPLYSDPLTGTYPYEGGIGTSEQLPVTTGSDVAGVPAGGFTSY